MRLSRQRRQNGFTVAGMLFALAILIVGSVIVLLLLNSVNSSQEGSEAQRQLEEVMSAIRKTYPGPNYNGISATNLVTRGVVRPTMGSSSTLVNTYGGTVTIAAASVASGTDNAFEITFPQVPRADCNVIASQTHEIFGRVAIGTSTVKDQFSTPTVHFSETSTEKACVNERNLFVFTANN